MNISKEILKMNYKEARSFLLTEKSFFELDLPPYFKFEDILNSIAVEIKKNSYEQTLRLLKKAKVLSKINYVLTQNKSTIYDWRPLQIIHPVIYVSLVLSITEKDSWSDIKKLFKGFRKNKKISCFSLPCLPENLEINVTESSIKTWWENIEQQSIKLSLDYKYLYKTDIINCYGSIYTHIIPWAIHGKDKAKTKEYINDKTKLGNKIDEHIRAMSYGQTNGIPQGSVLMDFVAEIVLGYFDKVLGDSLKKQSIRDYKILRYRDDYRIFVNTSEEGMLILKTLSSLLSDHSKKLNSLKTSFSDNVIANSMKPEKLYSLFDLNLNQSSSNIKCNDLLAIYRFSLKYPNSNHLKRHLNEFFQGLTTSSTETTKDNTDPVVLIAIIVEIAYRNSCSYVLCAGILSLLLDQIPNHELNNRKDIFSKIMKKFEGSINTGYLDIWLQRISYKMDKAITYKECLCMVVEKTQKSSDLWNNQWLKDSPELFKIINNFDAIDRVKLEEVDSIIKLDEITIFETYNEFTSVDLPV